MAVFGWSGLSAVAALEKGYIAAGPHGFADQRGGWATLWTSPDGSTWDRVQTMGDGYAMALAVTDAGTAVAGGMPGIDNFYAAVWAGPNFDPAAPPADPQPPPPPEPPIPTARRLRNSRAGRLAARRTPT